MRPFRRSKPVPDSAGEQVAEVTAGADYDAQSDLALPMSEGAQTVDDGFVPFAGELVPEHPPAAYDTGRDVGL